MERLLTLLILSISGIFAISSQAEISVKDFAFGDNRVISKRAVAFIKDGQAVNNDDWRVLEDAKGYIGGNSDFVVVAYDEPKFTEVIFLTGNNWYDGQRNCKFFEYTFGKITGDASLCIDGDYYVFFFVADRLSDGTEKTILYYFK